MARKIFKRICIEETVYDRIKLDKKHFSNKIGTKFSMSDTINEYHKILNTIE